MIIVSGVALATNLPGVTYGSGNNNVPVAANDNDAAATTPVPDGTQIGLGQLNPLNDPAIKKQLERHAAEARAAQEQSRRDGLTRQERIDRFVKSGESACEIAPTSAKCQAFQSAKKVYEETGDRHAARKAWNESLMRPTETQPANTTEKPTQNVRDDSARPSNNAVDPANSTNTGKVVNAGPQSTPETRANQRYEQTSNFLSSMEKLLGGDSEYGAPSPTDTERSNTPGTTPENMRGVNDLSSQQASPDPSVSTGVAYAAVQCYNQAAEAARACNSSLSRTQSASAQVQRSQMSAAPGTPSGCSTVGNATAGANASIGEDLRACEQMVSRCQEICASANSQASRYSGSLAAIQASEGQGTCNSARGIIATISINRTQIQSAYQAAASCYQQTTGQEFTPTAAGGGVRAAAAVSTGTESGGVAKANACSGDVCAADAGAGSVQLPNPKTMLADDAPGGGGQSLKLGGGGYREATDLPDLNSNFQMSTNNRPKATAPAAKASASAAAPAKNPGFFIRDKEAERRAREFANLPRVRGDQTGAGGARLAQKPGLERFVRRPANQKEAIGGKHTNIFTTITESYARNSENLKEP